MRILAINNKDEAVRKNSSSGGVFYLIAESVINDSGVVFGAKFDSSFDVVHGYAEDMEGIRDFMGSKYVQSSVGGAYRDAKDFLEAGRKVLFSGTPCQIAALKKYLGKEYENLITVDFICHGVPSRRVFREYLDEISKGREIAKVNFRDKTEGWRVFSLKVDFADGSTYRKNLEEDPFVCGFLKNLYLRPSCYQCGYRGFERPADVTLADFWGVQNIMPEIYDDKGTSIIIVRKESIEKLIEYKKDSLVIRELDEQTVQKTNVAVEKSCAMHPKRAEFFESECKSVSKAIYRIVKDPLKIRVKKKLYKLYKGVKK